MSRRVVQPNASGSRRGIVIGRDEKAVAIAWLAWNFCCDELLGQILGYPECCCSAFKMRWKEAAALHQGDLALHTLFASGMGPFDWKLNIFGRYFGYQIIQHFPCNFHCANSIELAERYAAAIIINEPAIAQEYEMYLTSPVVYTDYCGVFVFLGGVTTIIGQDCYLSYDPNNLRSTVTENKVFELLRSNNCISAARENETFTFGEGLAKGYLIDFQKTQSALCS